MTVNLRGRRAVWAAVVGVAAGAGGASGQGVEWGGGNGSWSLGANWVGGVAPGAGADVRVLMSSAPNRAVAYDYAGPAVTLAGLTLDNFGGGLAILNQPAGTTLSAGATHVGRDGRGWYAHEGGFHLAGRLTLGGRAGSDGAYVLSGDAYLAADVEETVGADGRGAFTQWGGTNFTSFLNVGGRAGGGTAAVGVYTLHGGSVRVLEQAYVGLTGQGTFRQMGGEHRARELFVGYHAGSVGAYALEGGSLAADDRLVVGLHGRGTLEQGGGVASAKRLTVGAEAGSSGAVTITNGTLAASEATVVADAGRGEMTVAGGAHGTGVLSIGARAAGRGAYVVSGGAATANDVHVGGGPGGAGGLGRLSVGAGRMTVAGTVRVYDTGVGAGTNRSGVSIDGGVLAARSVVAPDWSRLALANGELELGPGTSAGAGTLRIGGSGGDARLTLRGGTLSAGGIEVGGPGSVYAAFTAVEAAVTTAGDVTVRGDGSGGEATFVQAGGAVTVGGGGAGALALESASAEAGGTYVLQGRGALTAGQTRVGERGAGLFYNLGGTHATGSLTLGGGDGVASAGAAVGLYRLDEGAVLRVAGLEAVGYGGEGGLYQVGGSNSAGSFVVGFHAGGSGMATLEGGTLSVADVSIVGHEGAGAFDQLGGAHATRSLVVANAGSGGGRYDLSGGTLAVAEGVRVGGGGTLHHTGGTVTASSLFVAERGSATLTGGGGSAAVSIGLVTVAQGGALAARGVLGGERVENAGTLTTAGGADLTVSAGVLTNSGLLVNAAGTRLAVSPTTAFGNPGDLTVNANGGITLAGPVSNAGGRVVRLAGGVLDVPELTNRSGGMVRGFGRVTGDLVNSGNVLADGGVMRVGGRQANRPEAFVTVRGGILEVAGRGENDGFVRVLEGGRAVFAGGLESVGDVGGQEGGEGGPVGAPEIGYRGQVVVDGASSLRAAYVRQGWLTVAGSAEAGGTGGRVALLPRSAGGRTSVVSRLDVGLDPTGRAAARIDLSDGALVVDHAPGGYVPLADVRDWVAAGYNGGRWDGNGLTSSAAAEGAGALGYATAGEVLGFGGGADLAEFGGVTVDASSVLVRFTLAGDATLDGVVDFNDLVRLAQNYNGALAGVTDSWWAAGDFTYDGRVDFADLVKLAQGYNTSLAGAGAAGFGAGFGAEFARAVAMVPEPGAVAVWVGAAGAWAGTRRRWRR